MFNIDEIVFQFFLFSSLTHSYFKLQVTLLQNKKGLRNQDSLQRF